VKRECYSLCSAQGQTEEARRVCRCDAPKLEGIVSASEAKFGERVSDPRRLVPLPPEGNRRQVRRVGLDQQPLQRYQAEQFVVPPLVEGHDPAERHVPTGIERDFREGMRAGVAMHDSADASHPRLTDEGSRVVFRVPRVNDEGLIHLAGESYLRGKRRALGWSRGIVVVIVESAFADGDSGVLQKPAQLRDVAFLDERRGVVGMDSSRRENEPRVFGCVFGREGRNLERLADADDSCRARIAGAGDYRVAVAVERRVCEVGVTVDEDWRALVLRGHLRSIQRSTGAAT